MSNFLRNRRWWIGVAGVTIVLAISVAIAIWPSAKEPEYQGKKLSAWVAMAQESPHPPEVDSAIITIGTNNLPLLLRWLDYKPSKLREWVDDHSDNVPNKLGFLLRNERTSARTQPRLCSKSWECVQLLRSPSCFGRPRNMWMRRT